MPKILIYLHGRNGFGTNIWFKTTFHIAESLGIRIISPSLPDSKDPRYPAWKSELLSILEPIYRDNELYFITHSMGGYFLLRFIAENEKYAPSIRAAVLVGCPATKRPQYLQFYDADIDWRALRSKHIRFIFVYSRDDEIVKEEHQLLIKEQLGDLPNFSYHEYDGYGHFMSKSYPVLEDELLTMLEDK